MRGPKWIHRVPPSTERKSHASSRDFESTPDDGPVENPIDLPSLPDLLDELEADVDLNSLEQLTQSLLQDIARDLETTAQKTDCQESTSHGNSCEEMVGQTSTQLESSSIATTDEKSLENDISEYLLLHHNYAAKPPLECSSRTRKSKKSTLKNKLKVIRPKNKVFNVQTIEPEHDIIYGTLEEVNNVVTIVVDNEEVPVKEEEIIQNFKSNQDLNSLTVLTPNIECLSPMSCSDSDRGYESLDSPISLPEDIWDQSISELFPSLL